MRKFILVIMLVLSFNVNADCSDVTDTAFNIYSMTMKRVMTKEERYETYRTVWRNSEWQAELYTIYVLMAERMYRHNYDTHRMKAEAFQMCLELQSAVQSN
jgi:hypothetical protein